MAFPEQFLNELRNRSSLVDIIGQKVKLTRKGREHKGLCPFHKEKTPSFTVNEDKGFYHCFGCQAHGSVFDFIMETEGLSFPEAVERLASSTGMDMPRDTPEIQKQNRHRASLYDITEMAAKFFEKMLHMPEGKSARDYLSNRGIKKETVRHFRLGFAPSGFNKMKTMLSENNVQKNLAVAAGLLVQPENGEPYDRFRDRIIFPICDRQGRVIAFGGRIIGKGEPKYLNSPETALFHKGATLYGLHIAAPLGRKAETMVVTEGYMDVIALSQAGFGYTVAPLGTALTENQIKLLWNVVREPIMCFDGDSAGQWAAAKIARIALPLLKPGYGIRFALMPNREDPDSLISKKGSAAIKNLLEVAMPISEMLWHNETGGRIPSSAENRAALEHKLKEYTRKIQDSTVRNHFSRMFSERLWPQPTGEMRNYRRGRKNVSRNEPWTPNINLSSAKQKYNIDTRQRPEEVLLAVAINHPKSLDEIGERLGTMRFSSTDLDNIRQEVLNTLADEPEIDRGALVSHLHRCGYEIALRRILEMAANGFAQPQASLEDAISKWNSLYFRVRKRELAEEIEEAMRISRENPSDDARNRIKLLVNQKLKLEEEVDTAEFR